MSETEWYSAEECSEKSETYKESEKMMEWQKGIVDMSDAEFKMAVLKALEDIRLEIRQLNTDVNITWKGDR